MCYLLSFCFSLTLISGCPLFRPSSPCRSISATVCRSYVRWYFPNFQLFLVPRLRGTNGLLLRLIPPPSVRKKMTQEKSKTHHLFSPSPPSTAVRALRGGLLNDTPLSLRRCTCNMGRGIRGIGQCTVRSTTCADRQGDKMTLLLDKSLVTFYLPGQLDSVRCGMAFR